MAWNKINTKIRECRELEDPRKVIKCLENLFKTENDGMVALALGQEYQKIGNKIEALKYSEIAETLFPLPTWKKIAREQINRLKINDNQIPKSKNLAEIQSNKQLLIFLSYATIDSDKFQISRIAKQLTKFPEIEDVLYWEEDLHDDIISYMNDNLDKCDIFILFCSQNSLHSDPVKMEWSSALKIKKKIIPIFFDETDIPPLLAPKLGVRFRPESFEETLEELHSLILKKAKSN